jgi:hypothetical protein
VGTNGILECKLLSKTRTVRSRFCHLYKYVLHSAVARGRWLIEREEQRTLEVLPFISTCCIVRLLGGVG